ncbi:hypothetical protein G9A89_003762 [Geosiphon pyriformis]|nr:hypothetical protein G9A89_003762 [Geosiphon pyriformis]
METTTSSTTPKKKAPKGAFQGLASGFFSQKKKVVLGNVKHSGNKKDISLSKTGSSGSVYSDVESLSGEDEDVNMSGTNGGFLLGSAATTPKAKRVNTGAGFGSSLGSPNFHMDDDKVVLPSCLLMFTSKKSMEMAVSLARENKIVVNTNLKKQRVHSDQAVVIKEIPMDTPKDMIVTTVTEFGEIKSIRIQLIGMWQKTTSRDQFRVLLFTLPVGTTAHDFSTLLESAEGKTCIINCSLETGNRFCCAVVGFESNKELESAFLTEPIFSGICLFWAKLDLVQCGKCGHFGYSVLECDVSDVLSFVSSKLLKRPSFGVNHFQLARLYAKKNVLISCPIAFGGKLWAQVVSSASSSGGSSSSSGLFSGGMPPIVGLSSYQIVGLNDHLVVLERSLEILSDQVSVILKKLSFVDLVLLVASSCAPFLAVSVPLAPVVDLNMAINDVLALADPLFSGSSGSATVLSSSGSKVLTSKIGGLESKMSALEAFDLVWKVATCNVHDINIPAKQEVVVHWHFDSGNLILIITETKLRSSTRPWIANKFDSVRIFSSGLDKGFLGAGVAIIMADSLACHVAKIEEVPGHVMVASEVNSVIAKAVNSSCFIILGGDFNENGSGRSMSFKFCLGLGLVNLFNGHSLVSNSTWSNSKRVEKTINFIFVSESLASAVTGHGVGSISDFFDTNHYAVSVSVGLGGLLNSRLNSLCKQANKNYWKFFIKSWFRDCTSAKLLAVFDEFSDTLACVDVDGMWVLLEKVLVDLVDKIFSRHWFINQLINVWAKLNSGKAVIIANIIQIGGKSSDVLKQLSLFQKEYKKSKMYKSKLAEKASVRKAIECHMEKFCSDKGAMIKNVLDQLFHKIVLNHLVVNNELVLELGMVKLGVDEIMEGWIRKRTVLLVYALLDYVRNNAFSGVMCLINISELLLVVNNLSDGKAAGLFGIPNKLWKHCGDIVLKCLLGLLNSYLTVGDVFVLILMNTQPIALIKMARKILFKILSDRIFLACSKFSVLQGDNFLVLKSTFMQSPDMCKAYNLVGWYHLRASLQCIKMCEKFVSFFGNIHENRVNRVITDFGLSNSYVVCDGLDQGEVFSPLLWRIFYDPLLCESDGGFFFYFVAGAFVDDTIWVGNCQTATQNILDIASGFFALNDISINNKKTVAIPINHGVRVVFLCISGLPILIAKKDETHHYLGIFLSTDGLSKPSLAKAHSDVHFFTNVVLRKAITNKQFLYLVSAVLQPIVSYCTQFSFVSSSSLKSKAGLPHDFSTEALCYPSLYGLKFFEQVQSEEKLAALISFSNFFGVLGHLFEHRFLDLQVLEWSLLNPLQFSVKLCISPVNNFLAGVVRIFLCNELSLANNLPNMFYSPGHFSVLSILRGSLFLDSVHSLKQFGMVFGDRLFDKKGCVMSWKTFWHWKRLDLRGSVPHWFKMVSKFLCGKGTSMAVSVESACPSSLSILDTKEFSVVQDGLHKIWSDSFEVFTDGFVRNYGHVDVANGAAAYFPVIDLSVGIRVLGLLFSTMAKLQAITLALKCIPSSYSVVLHSNSQTAIDACVSEMSLSVSDFHSSCWLKRHWIFNLVCDKDLSIHWVKIKEYSRVHGNVRADVAAGDAALS